MVKHRDSHFTKVLRKSSPKTSMSHMPQPSRRLQKNGWKNVRTEGWGGMPENPNTETQHANITAKAQQQWILVEDWTLPHSFRDRGGARDTGPSEGGINSGYCRTECDFLPCKKKGFRGKASGITEGNGVTITAIRFKYV